MSATRKLEDHDLLSHEFQSICYQFYERVQREQPVYRMPGTDIYIITRQDDLKRAAVDYGTFSSRIPQAPLQGERWRIYTDIVEREGWAYERALNSVDPPEHRRSRKYLDAILHSRNVESLKPRIQQVADMLIDRFIDRGKCEFVSAFAIPFPSIIISEQIGFDAENIDTFTRWSLNLTRPTNHVLQDDELRECARTEVEMQHYLHAMMERRRAAPKQDLLTRIVLENSPDTVGGQPLTPGELQTVLRFVIAGAFGTVINLLGNALYLLLSHPQQMAKLRTDAELMPNFVEEALRADTSVQMLPRITTRDVEISGTRIPEGSVVMLHFGAANHDPEKFACPHAFDIERSNAGAHITFNTGPHLCPGRYLARQELQIAFATLLRRLRHIEIDGDIPHPPHIASWRHRMITQLPIRFARADHSAEEQS